MNMVAYDCASAAYLYTATTDEYADMSIDKARYSAMSSLTEGRVTGVAISNARHRVL